MNMVPSLRKVPSLRVLSVPLSRGISFPGSSRQKVAQIIAKFRLMPLMTCFGSWSHPVVGFGQSNGVPGTWNKRASVIARGEFVFLFSKHRSTRIFISRFLSTTHPVNIFVVRMDSDMPLFARIYIAHVWEWSRLGTKSLPADFGADLGDIARGINGLVAAAPSGTIQIRYLLLVFLSARRLSFGWMLAVFNLAIQSCTPEVLHLEAASLWEYRLSSITPELAGGLLIPFRSY